MIPLEVKEGDRILFGKYSGTEIKLDGQDYLILREDEILGILEGAGSSAGKEVGGNTMAENKLFMVKIPGRRFCAA